MGRRKLPRFAAPTPLELPGPVMRDMAQRAMDRIVRHIESLPEQPMHAVTGGRKLARALREPLPERGVPFERLLRLLFGRIIPASLNTASPGYLGYVPGGGLFHAALADLVAGATNRFTGTWQGAPGLVQIECNALDWFCALLGLPAGSGGLFTTGASLANLVALITARRERLPPQFQRGVVYLSDQAHHSAKKAAILAGILPERIRPIASDEHFRLRPGDLAAAVAADRAAGLSPFCAVASAGTVNTGAIDDLAAVAEIAARERLWLHVDAAYGGFFALTERGRRALAGIERADSIALDPHKGLFLPYGTGCLLVRDRAALERAHALHADYLPKMQHDPERIDFCDLGPELSRDARGLRVWLPLKMHGAAAFREALDEKLDLARFAAAELAREPDVEIAAPPELSLFAWRWRPAGLDPTAVDDANRRLLAAINQGQRVALTGTTLAGAFWLRLCILSFRTHRDRIEVALDAIRAAIGSLRHRNG